MPPCIFVYECVTAGDFPPPVPNSLRREGRAMLEAVVEDFARAGCAVVTSDKRGLRTQSSVLRHGLSKQLFQRRAADADYTLVIAPELHHLLTARCSWVLEAGGRLLGSSLDAIKLTADKLSLARTLKKGGVRTPDTYDALAGGSRLNEQVVVKPRWGAGSVDTFLVNGRPRRFTRDAVIQPYVPGTPASVAWLLGPRQRIPLVPALQRLSCDGRLRYLGGRMPLSPELARRAIDVSRRALDVVKGLAGYVGVDLVLGTRPAEDYVIEINPRLTMSYLGLRWLAKVNLAKAIMNVSQRVHVPKIPWRHGTVEFCCDGVCRRRGFASVRARRRRP